MRVFQGIFAKEWKEYGISMRQFALIRKLFHKFDEYISPYTDVEVIQDPQWHKLSDLAREIYPELMRREAPETAGFKVKPLYKGILTLHYKEDPWKSKLFDVFLDLVKKIGDPFYQERVWVKHLGPECDCFAHTTCKFFDVYEVFEADYEKGGKDYGISKQWFALIQELFQKFKEYALIAPDEDVTIVKDPKWQEVRTLAQHVYEKLKNTK